ncbi:MAG: hypothetical protein WCH57_07775 [Verrucomicrobiota bacterium]
MEKTLRVLNEMQAANVIGRYAIGGAVAADDKIARRWSLGIYSAVPLVSSLLKYATWPLPFFNRLLAGHNARNNLANAAGLFSGFLSR